MNTCLQNCSWTKTNWESCTILKRNAWTIYRARSTFNVLHQQLNLYKARPTVPIVGTEIDLRRFRVGKISDISVSGEIYVTGNSRNHISDAIFIFRDLTKSRRLGSEIFPNNSPEVFPEKKKCSSDF